MKRLSVKFPKSVIGTNTTETQNEILEFEQGKPLVILGANGSGKTRLGAKIEDLNDEFFRPSDQTSGFSVQRITAQKSLTISDDLLIKGLEAAEREAFTGNSSKNAYKIGSRYRHNPSTFLLDDYNLILSLFFARNNSMLAKQREADLLAEKEGKPITPSSITMPIEKALNIWNYLLPNRKLDLSNNEIRVGTHEINSSPYHGKEMSDGERVILYMIVQALSIKPNTLFIIDEPELHIHKAILNKLWDKLEEERQDCVFMYITHDLDFAVSRDADNILWVKNFDGNNTWEYEFIDADDFSTLPEDLLFEIIGTRKKIAFVEGTKNSWDYHLYQEIFKDKNYHIIPCGGCEQVANYVKAKRGYNKLSAIDVVGIVDRDFRTNAEIESLRRDGIYVLEVAEVENLFIVPELLDFICDQCGFDDSSKEKTKKLVRDIYSGQRQKQINEAFTKEIAFQMGMMHFIENLSTAEEIKSKIDERFTLSYIQEKLDLKKSIYLETEDLKEILRVFNFKELSNTVGCFFGCKPNEYPRRVIKLLRSSNSVRQRIIEAVKPYIPELP